MSEPCPFTTTDSSHHGHQAISLDPSQTNSEGYSQYSARPVLFTETRKQQLRENMHGYFLGPMDPTEFMSSFMPINSQNLGSPPDGIDFSGVYEQANEKSMYAPFVRHPVIL